MGREHDDLFAKQSIQLKLLTPAQVMECRDVLAELESAGITKTLAAVAVDQGALTRPDAQRLIDAINKKFPGKHPPFAGAAPEPAPKPAPKPVVRAAAPRKPAPRPAPTPPSAASSKKLPLLIGVSAVVVIVAAAGFFWKGSELPPQLKKPELVRAPEPPPPPPPPPPLPPKVEPKPEPKPAPPPPPPAPKEDEGRKAFEERLAERKKEGKVRLEEVLKEVTAQRKDAEEAAKAAALRLAGKTVTVTLTSGVVHKDATVKSWNFNGADLVAGGTTARVTWDTIEPASLLPMADLLFDPQRPQDQFDRGRFFVARRMWREAQAAFTAAAKLGQGFDSRVLDFNESLERLVTGQGGFRGSARRVGRDGVRLSWDFRDAKQLEDFSAGLAPAEHGALLDAPKKTVVFFSGASSGGGDESPLAFLGDFSAEMKLSGDAPVSIYLFFSEGNGYVLELAPSGVSLVRHDIRGLSKEARRVIGKSDKVKFPLGKTCDVRLVVSFPRFRVTLDGAEALSAEDGPLVITAEPPKGLFGLGMEKGKLRLEAPLSIQGRAEAAELDRRISDTEVMLRRALDPDLEQIEKFRNRKKAMDLLGEQRDLSLSSDDPYFAFRIKKFEDITKYEELKKSRMVVDEKEAPDAWKIEIDALVGKYADSPSLYYVRALVRNEHHDLAGALSDLRKAVELFPDFHEALGLLGEILMMTGDFEGALAAVKRALEARPDYIHGYIVRARCVYITSFGSKGFLEDLDIAQKLDPLDSEAVSVRRALTSQKVGPKDLGCRFDVETEHYRVTSDISAEASKRYGENLEAAYRHYAASFKVAPTLGFRGKPRVTIFQTAENYYTYYELLSEERGENTLGVFRPNLNELVLFESTDVAETNHVLYHEAVHHFMTLMTHNTPPYWYNEGIAEYMGSIRVEGGKLLEKAMPLHMRLPYIQQAIDVGADVAFDKIMNETPREFYSGNSPLKYAQAWSMIHFFYEGEGGKYRPLIEKYFALLREGRTPGECYDTVFRPKEDALKKEWREFTKKIKP